MKTVTNILLLLLSCHLNAQSKLRSSSADFIPVPPNYDSLIHWNKNLSYIELELVNQEWQHHVPYKVQLIKMTEITQKQLQEFRTTKLRKQGWEFLTVNVQGKIKLVRSKEELPLLIDTITSIGDAFLMLSTVEINYGSLIPLNKIQITAYSYKELQEGFYFLCSQEIDDCPITFADVLLFVDRNKNARMVDKEVTKTSTICR